MRGLLWGLLLCSSFHAEAQVFSEPIVFGDYHQSYMNPRAITISRTDEAYVLAHNVSSASNTTDQHLFSFDGQQRLKWERKFSGYCCGDESLAALNDGTVVVSLGNPYAHESGTDLKFVSSDNKILREFSYSRYIFTNILEKDDQTIYLAGRIDIALNFAKAAVLEIDTTSGRINKAWIDEEGAEQGLQYAIEDMTSKADGSLVLIESCAPKGFDAPAQNCDPAVVELNPSLELIKRTPTATSNVRIATHSSGATIFTNSLELSGLNAQDQNLWQPRRGPQFSLVANDVYGRFADLQTVGEYFVAAGYGKKYSRGVLKEGWVGAFDTTGRVLFEQNVTTEKQSISLQLMAYSKTTNRMFLVANDIVQIGEVEAPFPKDRTFSRLKLFILSDLPQ